MENLIIGIIIGILINILFFFSLKLFMAQRLVKFVDKFWIVGKFMEYENNKEIIFRMVFKINIFAEVLIIYIHPPEEYEEECSRLDFRFSFYDEVKEKKLVYEFFFKKYFLIRKNLILFYLSKLIKNECILQKEKNEIIKIFKDHIEINDLFIPNKYNLIEDDKSRFLAFMKYRKEQEKEIQKKIYDRTSIQNKST